MMCKHQLTQATTRTTKNGKGILSTINNHGLAAQI